jgi:hypothetical protein
VSLGYYRYIWNNNRKEVLAVKEVIGGKTGAIVLSLTLLFAIGFGGMALAQEKTEKEVCPKPYIKLIKPNLARAGQQVIIRGHRFGDKEKAGEVIFSPDISGNVIAWTNSRITVEVPAGAKTGPVVVKTNCAESNTEILIVEAVTGGEKK